MEIIFELWEIREYGNWSAYCKDFGIPSNPNEALSNLKFRLTVQKCIHYGMISYVTGHFDASIADLEKAEIDFIQSQQFYRNRQREFIYEKILKIIEENEPFK